MRRESEVAASEGKQPERRDNLTYQPLEGLDVFSGRLVVEDVRDVVAENFLTP